MKSNKKIVRILFDEREKRGSIEHFWHFLFGYYLPLVESLLYSRPKNVTSGDLKLVIQNCGPVVNQLLTDTLSAMNICYSWSDELKLKTDQNSSKKRLKKLRSLLLFTPRKNNELLLPRWDISILKNHAFPASSLKNIVSIQQQLPCMFPQLACCNAASANGKILILKRAPEHPFYSKSAGRAENRTYGAGRRTLRGVKECEERLLDSGIDCMIYESGSHNIFCQMNHFAMCTGIIGVRGSEFANLFWMKKGALAVMIHSEFFKNKKKIPPQRTLASLVSLKFIELDSNDQVSPRLDADLIHSIIKKHIDKA